MLWRDDSNEYQQHILFFMDGVILISTHNICFYGRGESNEYPQQYVFMDEAILMSTHKILCFYGEITKIIPKLSPNTLLINLFYWAWWLPSISCILEAAHLSR